MSGSHYELPDLPYDYGALEPFYSAKMLELHHSKHHAAYVKGANDTLELLEKARADDNFERIVGLEKTLAFNVAGHFLHSTFWRNLSPDGGDRPTGELADAFEVHFGSFDGFRRQMTVATTTVQGSGWGVLAWESCGKRLIVEQLEDHHGNLVPGSIPILVFDAWEHAYYLQYRNDRASYVDALWNVVDWLDVEARFTRARRVDVV
ncbi:MAG: superoxide dismutase [Acidimicrobiia bacterium]